MKSNQNLVESNNDLNGTHKSQGPNTKKDQKQPDPPLHKIKVVFVSLKNSSFNEYDAACIEVSDSVTMKEIETYLHEHQLTRFHSFMFTNKPAQKSNFSMEKTVRDIRMGCKMVKDSYIILCYEKEVNKDLEKSILVKKEYPNAGKVP